MLLFSLLVACGTSSPPDPSPLTADEALPAIGEVQTTVEPAPSEEGRTLSLDDWEYAILSEKLEKLRQGIRLSGPDGLGICHRAPETSTCTEFLGRSPESLPEGKLHIQAQVVVPRESTGWAIKLIRECHYHDLMPNETNPKTTNRTLKPNGTGRLETLKLMDIDRPAKNDRDCSYTLISLRPDGKEMWRESGQYSVRAQ